MRKTEGPDLLEVRQAQARNQADLRLQIAQGKIDYTAGVEYRRQQAPSGMGNSLGFFFSAPLPVFNRNQGEIVRAEREIEQAAAQIRALEARVDNEVAERVAAILHLARTAFEDIEGDMLSTGKERSRDDRVFLPPRRSDSDRVSGCAARVQRSDAELTMKPARAMPEVCI